LTTTEFFAGEKDEGYCFACGKDNPHGLHLEFEFDNDKLTTTKNLPREFQGYEGISHGGIVTTLMDEAMSKFVQKKYHKEGLTGRLEVRFHFPTPTEKNLKITAWEEMKRRNIISTKATVELEDGTITAEAKAKFAIDENNE